MTRLSSHPPYRIFKLFKEKKTVFARVDSTLSRSAVQIVSSLRPRCHEVLSRELTWHGEDGFEIGGEAQICIWEESEILPFLC